MRVRLHTARDIQNEQCAVELSTDSESAGGVDSVVFPLDFASSCKRLIYQG